MHILHMVAGNVESIPWDFGYNAEYTLDRAPVPHGFGRGRKPPMHGRTCKLCSHENQTPTVEVHSKCVNTKLMWPQTLSLKI